MSRNKFSLLASTALTVACVSGAAYAQTDPSCDGLLERVEALPQELPQDVEWTIEDVRAATDSGDADACAIILADVDRMMGESESDSDTASASDEDEAEMRAVETAQTRVTLQDEAVVEGTVFIDREAANVEVSEGQTEVMVTPGQPSVDVTEQAAQITVREQPARITVEMAQPTIRIEQPAPEIIITMPEPGVDVANAEPQIEVRQAEPTITVTQSSPSVDLELQVAENPDESRGIEVEDRRSGERFAMGESREMPSEDANVSVARSEPIVRMQSGDDSQAQVNFNRAEPTLNYERAEPEVTFSNMGEPSVEFARSGEPSVTIRRSGEDGEMQDEANASGSQDSGTQNLTGNDGTTETADAGSDMEQAEENLETAAADAGNALEAEAEETGNEIAAAADAAEREVEEETTELTAEATASGDENAMREGENAEMAEAGSGVEGVDGMTVIAPEDLVMSEIENAPLYGADNDRIGEVSQVVLSDDGLRVAGVVFEIGGFLGLGEHAVMLDLDRVQFARSDMGGEVQAFVSMTEEELEDMPEWDG